MLKKLAGKYTPKRPATLSANWEANVPVTFTAFLEEMVPSTIALPREVDFEEDVRESARIILGNASLAGCGKSRLHSRREGAKLRPWASCC
jgi:hypothetical protein